MKTAINIEMNAFEEKSSEHVNELIYNDLQFLDKNVILAGASCFLLFKYPFSMDIHVVCALDFYVDRLNEQKQEKCPHQNEYLSTAQRWKGRLNLLVVIHVASAATHRMPGWAKYPLIESCYHQQTHACKAQQHRMGVN